MADKKISNLVIATTLDTRGIDQGVRNINNRLRNTQGSGGGSSSGFNPNGTAPVYGRGAFNPASGGGLFVTPLDKLRGNLRGVGKWTPVEPGVAGQRMARAIGRIREMMSDPGYGGSSAWEVEDAAQRVAKGIGVWQDAYAKKEAASRRTAMANRINRARSAMQGPLGKIGSIAGLAAAGRFNEIMAGTFNDPYKYRNYVGGENIYRDYNGRKGLANTMATPGAAFMLGGRFASGGQAGVGETALQATQQGLSVMGFLAGSFLNAPISTALNMLNPQSELYLAAQGIKDQKMNTFDTKEDFMRYAGQMSEVFGFGGRRSQTKTDSETRMNLMSSMRL